MNLEATVIAIWALWVALGERIHVVILCESYDEGNMMLDFNDEDNKEATLEHLPKCKKPGQVVQEMVHFAH